MGFHASLSLYYLAQRRKEGKQRRKRKLLMATIVASLQSCCSQQHLRKPKFLTRTNRSSVAKKVLQPATEGTVEQKILDRPELTVTEKENGLMGFRDNLDEGAKKGDSVTRFHDEKWKNGTWDLNLFVRNGKMDWNGVIVAEARRRKHLEMYPEPATNDAPVNFSTTIIPWWAWLMRFHLPEAELLNGRAAMLGFFMAYFVDSLTGIGIVDQTSNFICKTLLFAVVTGIIVFWQTDDFRNLKQQTEEATFYDKQWQATWEDQQTRKSLDKD